MYSIYCHTFPNGKKYIGMTKNEPTKRWGNGTKYKTCPLLFRAIQKYGWDNVEHSILMEVSTLEEAERMEKHFITQYNTQNVSHGYNILPGGNVANNSPTEDMKQKLGNGWRGKERSAEDKKKISKAVKMVFSSREKSNGHFGLHHSFTARQKMSESQKKSWEKNLSRKKQASIRMSERMSNPEYRKKIIDNLSVLPKRKSGEWHMPEDAKAKISVSNKGKWVGDKSPCSKPVLQYSVDGTFIKRWSNAGEVERAGVAIRSNVSKCCRGVPHVKTVSGFIWKFEEQ